MRSIWLLICMGLLAVQAAEIDLLKLNAGRREMPKTGPYPLGVTLKEHRDGYLWHSPASRFSAVIDVGTVPVRPMYRYRLEWSYMPPQFLKMLIRIAYTGRDGREQMPNILGFYENGSTFIGMSKEFFTPPDVTHARFELVLFGSRAIEKPNVTMGFWRKLRLIEDGPQAPKKELENFYGKNLLPLGDFSTLKIGESDLNTLKIMPFGKLRPYHVEVVERDGRNVLKINYAPGDYQYMAWPTPPLPLYGCGGEIRCRIRGRGRAQLMIWYNRPEFATVFLHYGYFDLTPEWKDYTVGFGCDDPLVRMALFSFACRDNPAEIEIASMSMVFPKPEAVK